MRDEEINRDEILKELDKLRRRVAELEAENSSLRKRPPITDAQSRLIESRLRATIENTPIAAVQWYDDKGRVVFWNHASELMFGWSAEEALGKTLDQLLQSEEEAAEFTKALTEIQRTNRPVGPAEYHFRRKDGTKGFCLSTIFPIPSGDGVPCFACMDVDITDRKRTRAALRQSEERLRLAWETTPDALTISRLKDAVYVNVNKGYTLLTGYQRDEVIGKSALDVPFWTDPRDREPIVAALRRDGHIRNYETKLRRKDGKKRTVLVSAGLMTLDGVPHLLAVTKDIEDLKRAENALRESEQKYRLLAENVSDVIWTVDLDLRLTYISPSVSRMHGWTTDEALSLSPSDLMTPASLELVLKVLKDELALQGSSEINPNRVTTLELEQYSKDGTAFLTEVSASFLYDDMQNLIGIIGVTRDISEAKKTDNAIKSIVAAVSGEIGERFFESSVVQFAKILNADFTMIGEFSQGDRETTVRTIAFCAGGELLDNFEYDLNGSACQKAIESEICSCPRGAAQLFPRDATLQTRNVEAYVGVCLYDSRRKPIGIMAAMYEHPLENVEFTESVLRIFASRAAAEIERKRSEEHLNRLFTAVEQAGESILITDPSGRILYSNPAFAETTGYSAQETIGETAAMLSSGKHDHTFYRDMWSTIQQGGVWRGRFTNKKKDGTLYEETATISPIYDESGRVVNYVMVGRDVTTEALLQKQLLQAQKMEAVGTLAGGIAHDFNNLLQAIMGCTDLLLMKKNPTDPDRKKLAVIQHAVRDGADLVGRILTFSRKGESKTRPIDLNDEILRVEGAPPPDSAQDDPNRCFTR